MKTQNCMKFVALAAVAAAALFTGCNKQETKNSPESGAKCAKHDAPKELCFFCDASLREKGRLWCKEHDRYEDRCWLCHPEAQDKNRLWCKEHFLYEDECVLCHPELKKKPAEKAK